jgi:thioredoxin-like negative regulator of GroEL
MSPTPEQIAKAIAQAKAYSAAQQRLSRAANKLLLTLRKSQGTSSAEILAQLLKPLCADYAKIARKTKTL